VSAGEVALPDIEVHKAWFREWSAGFLTGSDEDNRYIELKRNHTMRVLENACRVVAAHPMAPEVTRAALLAALYHDVGRFPQYAQYRTFSDQRSVNHGILGCRTLRQEAVMRTGERRESRSLEGLVLAAVAMHNRFIVPPVGAALQTVTDVVRDSDKLDIFPVMVSTFTRDGSDNDVVTLHLEDRPDAWSRPVLDAVRERRLARYGDMQYVNDFKLLLSTWVFDLNFAESRTMLRERGLIEPLLATWPQAPEVQALKDTVRGALADV